jgi:hypothetical protein
MGADLLLASVVQPKGKRLDWAAGRRTMNRFPVEEVQRRLEAIDGEAPERAKEVRARANELISEFKGELENGGRDEHIFEVRDVLLHIRGGTSWGDAPSEGFSAFDSIGYFPEVLRAIGFEVD